MHFVTSVTCGRAGDGSPRAAASRWRSRSPSASLQPRQYTATARIVIEPPAGTDLRSAMAVSPIYLESLKTYEQFASGDSLFQKAIEQFDLRCLARARGRSSR